nr:histidine kinase [Ornithinimicrobium sp. F0845]
MFTSPTSATLTTTLTNVTIQVLVLIAAFAIGYSIGVRRDNIAALRERAEVAEREQGHRVEQARATERARIAREMHDVLAHRISLIAMNAGAMTYREDLPPEQLREIAGTVRDNADQAVQELRAVLGVLRGNDEPDQPRGPQPDLAQLGALLDDARAGGTPVVTTLRVDPATVPEQVSRHAYRIIQEGLTNARKHAPGQPVTVSLSGSAGVGLDLTVVNQPKSYGVTPQGDAVRDSGSGMGLLGLAERAVLSGGQLSYGTDRSGRFVVRAWLPWTS